MGEFNVNKTTGGLEQTAGMPETYPATQVMMSDGTTSVEEAISKNTLGRLVNLAAYTKGSPYICPSDGYIRTNIRTGETLYAYIDAFMALGVTDAAEQNIQSVLVKKGSKVYPIGATGNAEIVFIPFQ